MKRRILSALLALCMASTLLVPVSADQTLPAPVETGSVSIDPAVLNIEPIEHEGLGSVYDVLDPALVTSLFDLNGTAFSGDSYYTQLDPASQKVYNAILSSKIGTEGPSTEKVSVDLSGAGFTFNITGKITVEDNAEKDPPYDITNTFDTSAGSSQMDVIATPALLALLYDHPELSWLVNTEYSLIPEGTPNFPGMPNGFTTEECETIKQEGGRTYNGTFTCTGLTYAMNAAGYKNATTPPDYIDGSTSKITSATSGQADTGNLAAITGAINDAKSAIDTNLNGANPTSYDTVKAIHDWICENVKYAEDQDENSKFILNWRGFQTAYSALVEKETVCAGYAKSFKLLCDEYDIPCIVVTGTGGDQNNEQQPHAWNYVQLGDSWYAVDCTWDDQVTRIDYDYFLVGSDTFANTHTPSGAWDDQRPQYKFKYPALSNGRYVAQISACTVTVDNAELVYDGTAKTPAVTVKDGSKTLTAGTDYEVTYANNTNAGTNTGKVTVTGMGSYAGSLEKTFSIAQAEPTVSVSPGSVNVNIDGTVDITVTVSGVTGGAAPTGPVTAAPASGVTQFTVAEKTGNTFIVTGIAATGDAGVDLLVSYAGDTNYKALTDQVVKVVVSAKPLVADGVTITGDAVYTSTLTAEPVNSKADAGTLTYQWLRDGAEISGAANSTYTVTTADIGKKLSVRISGSGIYAPVTSGEVTAEAIRVTIALTVTPDTIKAGGTAAAETTVTATNGANKDQAVKDGTVTYASSDMTVATVSGSTITATQKPGTTDITAKFEKTGYETKTSEAVTLTVEDLPQVSVSVTDPGEKTYRDASFKLSVALTGENNADLASTASVTYTAGENGVVSVDTSGNVTINKAGEAMITVTAANDGYKDGTTTVIFTVKPLAIEIDTVAIDEKPYDRSTAATVKTLTFKNEITLNAADYTATAVFEDANAGENKSYTVTVVLNNANYSLAKATITGTDGKITKIAPTAQTVPAIVSTREDASATIIDLSKYLPAEHGGTVTYALGGTPASTDAEVSADGKLTLSYKTGAAATDETFTVEADGMLNYTRLTITVNVKYTDKTTVTLNIAPPANLIYDGSQKAVTVTSDKDDSEDHEAVYEYQYTGTDTKGTAYNSAAAPTNAGSYKVTVSIPDSNDTYAGTNELTFEITRARATVTANNKTTTVGDALPVFDCTISPASVTLSSDPTVACPTADNTRAGSYPITVTGDVVSADGNYDVTYVNGTLTVTAAAVAKPAATPNGGSFTGSQQVTLSAASGAVIYYTTDGSTPTTSSTRYTGPITLTSTTTIKAIAVKDGVSSDVLTVTFTRSISSGGSTSSSSSSVTVLISGDQTSVRVDATVSGSTAAVTKIDTQQIQNVIGNDVRTGMVEIDFTGLKSSINTVKLPTNSIGEIADAAQSARNDVEGLTIKLSSGAISFDGAALASIESQAGSDVTLTIARARTSDLNTHQREAVGEAPVFDLTLQSGGKAITRFGIGYVTVSLPYTLKAGEDPSGVVVYYLDTNGNIQACETMYDVRTQTVIFTTDHLSLYFIGYDKTSTGDGWNNPFVDVAANAWYYAAVRYVSENGLMSGYTANRFGPDDNLSRAQLAQILYNREGQPVVANTGAFTDVAPNAWYANAVRWASIHDIVTGYGDGRFGPDDDITREQLAVMLWRYAGRPVAANAELQFDDAGDASNYAVDALCWAVENGIISGYGDGQLVPKGLASRSQVAQMLKNYLDK